MVTTRRKAYKDSPDNLQNGTNAAENVNKSGENEGWMSTVIRLDEKYTSALAVCANKDSKYSSFRPLMKVIEISCHGIPWLLGTIVLLLSVHRANDVEALVNLFYGLILDLIVIATLKVAFRRSRPAHNEMDMFATVSIDNYSFPSGHASRVGMLTCFFTLYILTSKMWIFFVLVWGVIVCLSRVILGRHHLVDVVCGAAVGFLEYLLLLYLWIPTDTCMSWLELYFSHFHL